jgi:hypothetical protein
MTPLPPLPTQARENEDARDDDRMRSLRVSPSTRKNDELLLLLLLLDENNNNDDDIYRKKKKKKKKKKNDVALCRWMSTRARDSALEEAPSARV